MAWKYLTGGRPECHLKEVRIKKYTSFRCVAVVQSASTGNPNALQTACPSSRPYEGETTVGRPRHGQHPVGRTTTARQDFTLLTRSISVGVWHLPCLAEAGAPLLRRTAFGVRLAGPFWGPLPASRVRKDSAPSHRLRKSGHLPRRSAGALSQRRASPLYSRRV